MKKVFVFPIVVLLSLTLLLAQAVPALAASIEQRQMKQQHKIDVAVRNGWISRGQADRLQQQQMNIQDEYRHALRKGYLTPGERKRITRMQNNASQNIRRYTHNRIH